MSAHFAVFGVFWPARAHQKGVPNKSKIGQKLPFLKTTPDHLRFLHMYFWPVLGPIWAVLTAGMSQKVSKVSRFRSKKG